MGLDGVKDLEAYEYVSSQRLENLKSEGMILKHKKSGARICLISNDDENKVFYIGFRTPPVDSTGLQHIMEHSVLCGSKKYPVKDPFIELAKGSLNTFLNAMTYPDKTVYPVASCNDKDFQNLMNVYLDAVFYPNIYTREQIFKQEGWHYELKDATDPVTINGVVYNEMKGVYSSADDVLEREIISSLFPDSVYSNESGGDPKVIPTLTYDKFIEYHRNFYHPCNSYIYLYGNMDMAEKLEFIDREYLRDYDVIDLDTAIELQKPFSSMNRVTKYYPVTDDDEQTDGTYLSYNTVIDTVLDRELYLAFQIIEYSLLTAPGAVLKQKLLDKGIGEDIYGSYDNGIYQPYFTVVSKNANEEDAENFLNTIKDVLSQVVKEGLDKKSLRAGLNVLEFRYRENDFGGYPKGLVYGLEALDSWLYDENHPFMHIEILDVFEKLKGLVDTDYFEKLIDKYLLNNTHSSFVVLRPKAGLQDEIDEQLTKELEAYKAQLSEAQINELVESTKELIAYQEEPSTGEELETIPLLEISDIKESIIPFKNTLNMVEDTKVLTHDIFTNGIGYLTLGFDCDNISTELLPYLALLSNILGLIDTENYSYADLTSEIFLNSGGISSELSSYSDVVNVENSRFFMEFKIKILLDKLDFAFNIIDEVINKSILDCPKRLKELINIKKSRMQMSLMGSSHVYAAMRALTQSTERAVRGELIRGISFYNFIEECADNFDTRQEEIIDKLKRCMNIVFRKENLFVDYIAPKEENNKLLPLVAAFRDKLYEAPFTENGYSLKLFDKNEGFRTAGQVQYVALAGNFKKHNLEYKGSLRVLKTILGYDYLWNNVRVKGGAYGCMSNFDMTGDYYLVSYRDPNLKNTLDIYNKAAEYISNFECSKRDVTKYIIGTISDMDIPLTPSAEGKRSMNAYLCNMTDEMLLRSRKQVLSTDIDEIRSLSEYLRVLCEENHLCVVGSNRMIEQDADLFDVVTNLV